MCTLQFLFGWSLLPKVMSHSNAAKSGCNLIFCLLGIKLCKYMPLLPIVTWNAFSGTVILGMHFRDRDKGTMLR